MGAWMIDAFGSDELKQRFLPRVVGMEALVTASPNRAADRMPPRSNHRPARWRPLCAQWHQAVHFGRRGERSLSGDGRTGEEGPKGISCLLVEKGTPASALARPNASWAGTPAPPRR
jgi:hypothetical protein